MTKPDILTEAQSPSPTSMTTIVLMGIVLVALAMVIGAMEAGTTMLLQLIREMVALLFAQLGRLLLIGLCLLCLVLVLLTQLKAGGAGAR
ncbi:MAG TPA: hypothetical protein VGE11_09955 [Pseudonocardia sp.]